MYYRAKKVSLFREVEKYKTGEQNILKLQTILIIGLGAGLLAGCPAKTENTNTANNINKTNAENSSTANKNTNTAVANNSAANDKPVEKVKLDGNWESEFFNKKGENYTQMTLYIEQKGDTINGTYSVVDYVGDEAQIEDGNQTPFTGTLKDNVADIKFDTNATVPAYEENVKYKEPTDGKPSTATLTMDGGKIKWKHAGGETVAQTPKEIVLTKIK